MKNKKHCGKVIVAFWTAVLIPGNVFAVSDSETVALTFNIRPVTVVKATSSGARGVNMGPVVPGIRIPSEPLDVVIDTNTNDRYRVYHEVRNRPVSGSGEAFPEEGLQFMAGNGAQGGTSAIPAFTPVPNGRVLMFQSIPSGGADRFSVWYAVESKKLFGAGNYYGDIYFDVETV